MDDHMDDHKIDHTIDHTIDSEMERRRELADRNVHAVISLLERRADIRGIYPMADLVADNVGWVV